MPPAPVAGSKSRLARERRPEHRVQADSSPEGNEIIVSVRVTRDVHGSMWVVHAGGTGLHEVHIQGLDCGASNSDPNGFGCHGPRWSPDDKEIIFAADSPAVGTNIHTANADGTASPR